jgi:hypothetical protein
MLMAVITTGDGVQLQGSTRSRRRRTRLIPDAVTTASVPTMTYINGLVWSTPGTSHTVVERRCAAGARR